MKRVWHFLLVVISVSVTVAGFGPESKAQGNTASSKRGSDEVYPTYSEPGLVYSSARLPRLKREDMDEYGKKVYDAITSSDPSYKDGVKSGEAMWLYSPRFAENLFRIRNYIRVMPVGQRYVELAILVACREQDNQFEWTRTEPAARKVGLEPEVIDVVKYGKDPSKLGEKEAVIIRLGREMISAKKVSDETYEHAMKLFGPRNLTDLIGTMSFFNFLHDTIITFDLHRVIDERYVLPSLPRSRDTNSQVNDAAKARPGYETTPSVSSARLPMPRQGILDEDGKKVLNAAASLDPSFKNGGQTVVSMFLYSPPLAEHLFPIRSYIREMSEKPVGQKFSELAILVAARELNNQFEWTGHSRGAGLTPETMEVVKYRKDPSNLGEKEAAIIRLIREMVGERKVSDETFAQALRVLAPRELMDLIGTVSFYDNFVYNTVIALDVQRVTPEELILPPLPKS